MTSIHHDARKIETEFLTAIAARLDDARSWLPGSTFRRSESDDRDLLREMMRERRLFDTDLPDRLPNNGRLTLTGRERPWYWFGSRKVSAATASVLAPLDEVVDRASSNDDDDRGPLRPVSRGELAAHIEALTSRGPSTRVIGVCGPSGFSDEAKRMAVEGAGLTVVLIEPHRGGGWSVTDLGGPMSDRAVRFFDPEGDVEKVRRVRGAVEDCRSDLMSAGLNAADLAEQLGVGQDLVEATFQKMAAQDGRLHVTMGERACILYYTAIAVKETPPMSILDFFKRITGRSTSPAEKIKELQKKQTEIDDNRREFDKNLSELAGKRKEFRDRYKQAGKDQIEKRRLVSQLAQLDQEINLQNEKASILTKQSQVLGRQVHNLEVAQTARTTEMPSSEDITETAAIAETALEELDETYEAVRTVSSAVSDQSLTEEEAAIEAELEAELASEDEQAAPESAQSDEFAPPESTESKRAPEDRQREAN